MVLSLFKFLCCAQKDTLFSVIGPRVRIIQGYPRSMILVPIGRANSTSIVTVTMVLSCTVSEIRPLLGRILRIFLFFFHSAPSLTMSPLEFRGEVRPNREETRVMGQSCSEDRIIVA